MYHRLELQKALDFSAPQESADCVMERLYFVVREMGDHEGNITMAVQYKEQN